MLHPELRQLDLDSDDFILLSQIDLANLENLTLRSFGTKYDHD